MPGGWSPDTENLGLLSDVGNEISMGTVHGERGQREGREGEAAAPGCWGGPGGTLFLFNV